MSDDLSTMADGDATAGISIHSGFPNPAAAHQGRGGRLALDFNQLLVQHPSSTYVFRLTGESWAHLGIFSGDIAVIDRALTPRQGDIVLRWINEVFELQQYQPTASGSVWGVASAVIHQRSGQS